MQETEKSKKIKLPKSDYHMYNFIKIFHRGKKRRLVHELSK